MEREGVDHASSHDLKSCLSREEILQSPSREDGISWDMEQVYRQTAIAQLMQIGQKKEVKKQVIATACVLFHRFFSRRSLKRFDRFDVALVCLVLAGKTVDFVQPILFKSVIPERLARHNQQKPLTEESDEWKATKEQLCLVERQVLSALEFDLATDLPFHHVDELCQAMSLTPADHPLREVAIKMLNDLLKTTLVLQYRPVVLAQAALLFARSQLDKLHATGKGPAVTVPPAWEATVPLPTAMWQEIVVQFSESVMAAKRQVELQRTQAAGGGGGTA